METNRFKGRYGNKKFEDELDTLVTFISSDETEEEKEEEEVK